MKLASGVPNSIDKVPYVGTADLRNSSSDSIMVLTFSMSPFRVAELSSFLVACCFVILISSKLRRAVAGINAPAAHRRCKNAVLPAVRTRQIGYTVCLTAFRRATGGGPVFSSANNPSSVDDARQVHPGVPRSTGETPVIREINAPATPQSADRSAHQYCKNAATPAIGLLAWRFRFCASFAVSERFARDCGLAR